MSRHALIRRRGHDEDPRHEHRHEEHRHDDGTHTADHATGAGTHRDVRGRDDSYARDHFGGFNWGACFFGWLVAVGVLVLLTGIVSAVATAVGANADFTQTDAEQQADTLGLAAVITLAVVLFLSYYAGGYVAGRMSRYDGGRQGLGVWIIGLLVTVVAAVLGWVFGTEYNIFEPVDLPAIPLTADELGAGAAIAGLVVLGVTLIGALLGGKVGHRYHDKVDRAAGLR